MPPSQNGLDGAAAVNSSGNQVSVIFGGGTGANAVTVNGLSSLSAFGSTANVKLEYTPSKGRTTAVSGPLTISQTTYTITNGSITVPVAMNPAYGYHLVITPSGSTSSLAGTYQIKNVNSGLALDTQNAGTAQGTLADQNTPGSGSHPVLDPRGLRLRALQDPNSASGLMLGITNESTSDGGTALIWGDNGTPDHLWQLVPGGQRPVQDRQ